MIVSGNYVYLMLSYSMREQKKTQLYKSTIVLVPFTFAAETFNIFPLSALNREFA